MKKNCPISVKIPLFYFAMAMVVTLKHLLFWESGRIIILKRGSILFCLIIEDMAGAKEVPHQKDAERMVKP
jgi:hypothetical protein